MKEHERQCRDVKESTKWKIREARIGNEMK